MSNDLTGDVAYKQQLTPIQFGWRTDACHGECTHTTFCSLSALNRVQLPCGYSLSTWAHADSQAHLWGLGFEHDSWTPGGYTTVADEMAVFALDQWGRLQVNVVCFHAQSRCDGAVVSDRHDEIGLPKKMLAIDTVPHTRDRRRDVQ